MTQFINNNFDKIWARIKKETPIKNLTELAEIAGITQSGLSKAKGRDNFSANWAYSVGKKYGLLTEWIMTGEGPKRRSEGMKINPLLVEVNEWLNEGEKHKSAEFRTLFQQQMIRAFFDYEEWRRKRDQQEGSGSGNPRKKVA